MKLNYDLIKMLQAYIFGGIGLITCYSTFLLKPFIGTCIASFICMYVIQGEEDEK